MKQYTRQPYKKTTITCKQCGSTKEAGGKAEYCSIKCKSKFHKDKKKKK